ncbi:MAG TPA: DNA recombination protein RmuC, partial [Magnetospirillum sp.]|nr:DNA recombination protein RmuC [Magnetospirillum sp.]
MDATVVIVGLVALMAVAVAAWAVVRQQGGSGREDAMARAVEGVAQAQATLTGRLAQLAETQAAAQSQMA